MTNAKLAAIIEDDNISIEMEGSVDAISYIVANSIIAMMRAAKDQKKDPQYFLDKALKFAKDNLDNSDVSCMVIPKENPEGGEW